MYIFVYTIDKHTHIYVTNIIKEKESINLRVEGHGRGSREDN